jgi:transcription elongation factor Elf1
VKTERVKPQHESETRKLVKELRSASLSMTMSEIARKTNVSRQRVFAILKDEGLPTKHQSSKLFYECPLCGNVSTSKFCSAECKKEWGRIQIVCTGCGKLFTRDIQTFLKNYRHHGNSVFCSKQCAAKWIGTHHGFKRFPNHRANFDTVKR